MLGETLLHDIIAATGEVGLARQLTVMYLTVRAGSTASKLS